MVLWGTDPEKGISLQEVEVGLLSGTPPGRKRGQRGQAKGEAGLGHGHSRGLSWSSRGALQPGGLAECSPMAGPTGSLSREQSAVLTVEGRFLFFFFLFFWKLITILWWFLPYVDRNQPQLYMCPPSQIPLHLLPHPTLLRFPSAPGTPCFMHQTWTGDLFHLW